MRTDGHSFVELRLRGRPVARAAAREADGEAGVLTLLRRGADELLAAGAREAGVVPTCREGCSACCRQLVPLAAAEADDLRRRVEAMPPARRADVEARFAAAVARLEATGLIDLLADSAAVPPDGLETLGRHYLAAGVDCPFLEDDRCTIYEHRPMACRQHAVSSAPAECAQPAGRVRRIAPLGRAMNAALDGADGTGWVALPLLKLRTPAVVRPNESPARLAAIWHAATRGEGSVELAPDPASPVHRWGPTSGNSPRSSMRRRARLA